MPSRLLSWSQLVREADPNWEQNGRQPWVYEFSNGRRLRDNAPLYNGIVEDPLTDEHGWFITNEELESITVRYDSYYWANQFLTTTDSMGNVHWVLDAAGNRIPYIA